jgi:quercetin dioxygenase-like cupin family protein
VNKKQHTDNLEQKIIFDSLGLLDKEERVKLESEVRNMPAEEKNIISNFNNLVSLFPKVLSLSLKETSPSPGVKEKLFEKLKKGESKNITEREGFEFIYSDSGDWFDHPVIKGIKVKQLARNNEKDYVMILMKVEAGTSYPSHHHSGAEECYVIEGDVYAEGKILGPGDFHHAEGGSDHEPLYTKNGCTLLLVVDPEDY